MSLTSSDLKSIKDIVDTSVNASETGLIKRIDGLDVTLSMQMGHGLQEIRDTVNRIEKVQFRYILRLEDHDLSINHIRKTLHAA